MLYISSGFATLGCYMNVQRLREELFGCEYVFSVFLTFLFIKRVCCDFYVFSLFNFTHFYCL